MEKESCVESEPLDAVVGLGGNVGSRRLTLSRAVDELAKLGELIGVSALYESVPVGGPPQPDFLNAAARLRYSGRPSQLLGRLLQLERAAGRERRERWGPRTLDLDILWIKGLVLQEPGLELPHPRLRERAFALRPLVDVAPDARDPRDDVAYALVLAELGSFDMKQVERAWTGPGPLDLPRGMDRLGP